MDKRYFQRMGFSVLMITLMSCSAWADPTAICTWEYDQLKPRVAFNSTANEFLAVWEDHHWGWGDDWDIYGRRVNAEGTPVGSYFAISWEGTKHRLNPDVAYNSQDNEYLVVWEDEYSESDHDIWARRVASDGALIGDEFTIFKASNETCPSWHIIVKYNRRNGTITPIGYCCAQVVRGNFQNLSRSLDQSVGKRIGEPYTINIIRWFTKKLNTKDIGNELMSK